MTKKEEWVRRRVNRFYEFVGNLVKDARIYRNMSQKELAEKSGLSLDIIQKYESGQIATTGKAASMIAKALDIPMLRIHPNTDFGRDEQNQDQE